MKLKQYANEANDIRAASEYARGIMDNLKAISSGLQITYNREQMVGQVDVWFRALADKLGYTVKESVNVEAADVR